MKRKYGLILLVACLILSAIFLCYTRASALVTEQRVTHYRLDTGVIFLWKNSAGTWQNGLQPGGSHSFYTQFQVGKNMENVKVYPYLSSASKNQQGYFAFSGDNYHWNKTKTASDKSNYDQKYYAFSTYPRQVSGAQTYSAVSGNMTVTYQLTFKAHDGENYDLKRKLAEPGGKGKQEVLDLLGTPNQEIVEKMNLLDPASESYSANVEGYLFFLPIIIQYDEVTLVEIPEPKKEPDETEPQKPQEPGEEKPAEETKGEEEPAKEPKEVHGTAVLEFPAYAYEGHPVLAEDVSEYTVDGTGYSARRAYSEKLASNSFAVVPSSAGKSARIDTCEAEMIFPQKGFYQGKLTINIKGGGSSSDTKPIEVRKTPYIEDHLSGFQKQNRKQVLRLTVATYPDKPLTSHEIIKETGQTVTLTDGRPQQNTAIIKTRAINKKKDAYFTVLEVEFLTKEPLYNPDNPEKTREFEYYAKVTDGKGDSDEARKTFTVTPDLPPNPEIQMDSLFIREKDSNIAKISCDDQTVAADGDEVFRDWFFREGDSLSEVDIKTLSGYENIAFGTDKTVGFDKEGVGKFSIRLFVREKWTEPTLEEYIAETDYLTGSAIKYSEVDNIAPIVSLDVLGSKSADIVLTADTEEEYQRLLTKKPELKATLLSHLIDAQIKVKRFLGSTPQAFAQPSLLAEITQPNGYEANGGFFDGNLATVDERYLYYITYTWPGLGYGDYPTAPISVTCYDAYQKTQVWRYTTSDKNNFFMAHDNEDQYLYLVYQNKTVILDKATGTAAGTLPVALGKENYLSDQFIYSLRGSDLLRMSIKSARAETLHKGVSAAAMASGRLQFATKSNDAIVRNSLDLKTGAIQKQLVYGREQDPGFSSRLFECIGIDAEGQFILWKNSQTGGGSRWIMVYDAKGKLTGKFEVKSSGGETTLQKPVMSLDAKGSCNYIMLFDSGSGSPMTSRQIALDIRQGKNANVLISSNIVFPLGDYIGAYERNGKADFIFGSFWVYTMGGGAYAQPPQYTFTFDGGASLAKNSTGRIGQDARDEYGSLSRRLVSLVHGNNTPNTGSFRIKTAVLPQSAEEEKTEFYRRYVNEETITGGVSIDAETIVRRIEGDIAVLKINKEGGNNQSALGVGALDKEFALSPGKYYEYEYEYKPVQPDTEKQSKAQPVNLKASHNIIKSKESFEAERYYVEEVYAENFDGVELNPLFKHKATIKNGKIGVFSGSGGSGSAHRSYSGSTAFTVPKGKRAVVEFDFEVSNGSNGGWLSGVYINGERFINRDHTPHSSKSYSGNYLHPYLLKEGENILSYECFYYGSGTVNHVVAIDNLKVYIVSENQAADSGFTQEESGEGGWIKVKGGFAAPCETISYGSKSVSYNSGVSVQAENVKGSGNNYSNVYTLTIPSGYLSKTFAFPSGSSAANNGPTFVMAGKTYQMVPGGNTNATKNIESGQQIYLGVLSGTTMHTANYNTSYTASSTAFIPRFEQLLYKSSSAAMADKIFFNDNKNRLFEASETYTGKTTLSLEMPDDTLLRNLKVYYVENGKRVYVEDYEGEQLSELLQWKAKGGLTAKMTTVPSATEEERAIKVYKKGQLVQYGIRYYDHENDPGKKQYWRYTHTPFNDGLHSEARQILDAPIDRFYIDGKYTVEHWQEDDTTRGIVLGGNPSYDKVSNVENITFYVEGTAKAPWITSITQDPVLLKAGDSFRIKTGVDDEEKDVLSLTTEVYQEKKLIYTHLKTEIKADATGKYPYVYTDILPESAKMGIYEVVCTVRDETGAGLDTHRFIVTKESKITGWVQHTEQWEQNRKNYNVKNGHGNFDRVLTLSDYISKERPRPRGSNVFWPGERFMLEAAVSGEATKVAAEISGYSNYMTTLINSGRVNEDDETIYTGSLWDSRMANQWGLNVPEPLTFLFTAYYEDGLTKEYEVTVIMDRQDEYWLLHRVH